MAHYEETDHLVACLAWDRVAGAGLLAAHRGSPLRLRPTGDKPELAHQPADQLRADLPAGADERDVLAPVPVGAVEVVEQLRLWGGCWQLEVKERPTLAPHHSSSGSLLGRLLAGWTATRPDTPPPRRSVQSGGGAKAQSGPVGQPGHPLRP
jgi:hypothetical protein